jgi:hypothetical protein
VTQTQTEQPLDESADFNWLLLHAVGDLYRHVVVDLRGITFVDLIITSTVLDEIPWFDTASSRGSSRTDAQLSGAITAGDTQFAQADRRD